MIKIAAPKRPAAPIESCTALDSNPRKAAVERNRSLVLEIWFTEDDAGFPGTLTATGIIIGDTNRDVMIPITILVGHRD